MMEDNTENDNNDERKRMNNLECDKSLTISSGGYENLPSPMNHDEEEDKTPFRKNIREINFGRRIDDLEGRGPDSGKAAGQVRDIKTGNTGVNLGNQQLGKKNDDFLKFIADNSVMIFGDKEKEEIEQANRLNLQPLYATNTSNHSNKLSASALTPTPINLSAVKNSHPPAIIQTNNLSLSPIPSVSVANNTSAPSLKQVTKHLPFEVASGIVSFSFPPTRPDLSKELSYANQLNHGLHEKLALIDVRYKEVCEEYKKLQAIYKDLERFYLEMFNLIYKKGLIRLNSNADNKIFNEHYQSQIKEIIESNLLSLEEVEQIKELKKKEQELLRLKENISEMPGNITNQSHIHINEAAEAADKSASAINESINKSLISYKQKTNQINNGTKLQGKTQRNNTINQLPESSKKAKKAIHSYYANLNRESQIAKGKNHGINASSCVSIGGPGSATKTNFSTIPNNFINFDQKFNEDEFQISIDFFSLNGRGEGTSKIAKNSYSTKDTNIKSKPQSIPQPQSKTTRRNVTMYKELETQTDVRNEDIDRVLALNDEYSEQLVVYQQEIEKLEANCQKLEEGIQLQPTEIEYIPELIPPEETFKIFMYCLKNIKVEGHSNLSHFINQKDLVHFKNFVKILEKDVKTLQANTNTDAHDEDSYYSSNSNASSFKKTSQLYSKYRNILRSIANKTADIDD